MAGLGTLTDLDSIEWIDYRQPRSVNAPHMNHAIYRFKRVESASLDYALTDEERERRHAHEQIGLGDTVAVEDA